MVKARKVAQKIVEGNKEPFTFYEDSMRAYQAEAVESLAKFLSNCNVPSGYVSFTYYPLHGDDMFLLYLERRAVFIVRNSEKEGVHYNGQVLTLGREATITLDKILEALARPAKKDNPNEIFISLIINYGRNISVKYRNYLVSYRRKDKT